MAIVLTAAAVVLGLATIQLIGLGRRIRLSSRIVGILLAAAVSYGGAELATRLWQLVASHAVAGAGIAFVVAREMGARARDRVVDRFLAPRQPTETMELVGELV